MRRTLILLSIFIGIVSQQCFNDGVFLSQFGVCQCIEGFIGKQCKTSAYEIKQEQIVIPLSDNFTYTYFNSKDEEMFRFILQFCLEDKTKGLHVILHAQEQQKDGEIKLNPNDNKDQLEIIMGNNRQCVKIYSSVFLSSNRKLDDTLPKIIFGFKQGKRSAFPINRSLLVKCEVDYYLSTDFVVVLIVLFLVVVIFSIAVSTICLFRQRLLQRNRTVATSKKRIQIINKIMPSKAYQSLVEQTTQNTQNIQQSCSICLCAFERNQNIRKTPCGHIYHEDCLDGWCEANLNCPICRRSFENDFQLKDFSYLFNKGRRSSNLRQVIL